MVRWLLLTLALGAPSLVFSQGGGILELPTVTVVGADTLFLQAPPPRQPELPPRPVLALRRLALPERGRPRLPAEPSPAAAALRSVQAVPRAEGPEGTAAAPLPGDPLAEVGASSPQFVDPVPLTVGALPVQNWTLLALYVPGQVLRSGMQAVRSLGSWELGGDLDITLADGWASLSPAVPNVLLGRLEVRRDGPGTHPRASLPSQEEGQGGTGGGTSLCAILAGSAGAYQPPGFDFRYSLGFAEELALRLGRVLLTHSTDAVGLSLTGTGRLGLLGQRLSIDAYPGRVLLHAGAVAYLRGTLQPQTGQVEGLLRLGVGYRGPGGAVALAAGGSCLHWDGELFFRPEAGLQLSPWEGVGFQLGAAAFLAGAHLDGEMAEGRSAGMPWPVGEPGPAELAAAGGTFEPLLPMGILRDAAAPDMTDAYSVAAQVVADPGSLPLFEPQHGYAARAALVVAPGTGLRARLAAEYLYGSVYDGWGGVLTYRQVSRVSALVELSAWVMRFGDAGGGLEAALRGVASLPLPSENRFLEDLYGERLEGELRLAFPNFPLRIIMGALWGEIPAGLPTVAQLSPWEPFAGLAAALSAEYRLNRRHAVRAGCEVYWQDTAGRPGLRFVAGYRFQ